jgi:hypothetical protein
MATDGLIVHAALAYKLIQLGSDQGLPQFAQAQLLQKNADYTPYLMPSDFPLEEFYPGITTIIQAPNTGIAAQLNSTLFPLLQQLTTPGPKPLAVSYGAVTSAAAAAVASLQQLESLNAVPPLLDAEWGAVCDGLQTLTLFPEAFSP